MATQRICSIPDCGNAHFARGWCCAHWKRWRRHGDPLGGGTINGAPMRFYREVVLTDDRGLNDPCLIWPFWRSTSGYGRVYGTDGLMHPVSRLICEERHGPPPTPDHDAAHECGKGHEGCVTGGHLSWKTRAGNMADQLTHGTRVWGERHVRSKLTEADVRRIRELKGKMVQREIGDMFGITRSRVSTIHSRKAWAWLP